MTVLYCWRRQIADVREAITITAVSRPFIGTKEEMLKQKQ